MRIAIVFVSVAILGSCFEYGMPGATGSVFVRFTWNESAKTLVAHEILYTSGASIETGPPISGLVNGQYYRTEQWGTLRASFSFSDASSYIFYPELNAEIGGSKDGFLGRVPVDGKDNYYTVNLDGPTEVITVSHNP